MDSTDKIILLIAGIGFAVGVAFILLRPKVGVATYKVVQSYQNEETWDMWEDEKGHIHTIIHRKVNAVD